MNKPEPRRAPRTREQILSEIETVVSGLDADSSVKDKAALRRRLLRLAHSPKLKPFTSSTQLGIKCRAAFEPADSTWASGCKPLAIGKEKIFSAFRPDRVLAKEAVTFIFRADGREAVLEYSDDIAADAWLVQAFVGPRNCYPNAPNMDTGIALSGLRDTYVDWPVAQSGAELHIGIGIDKAIMQRVTPPAGFAIEDLAEVQVMIAVDIYGETA